MSQIDFASLARERPDLAVPLSRVASWFEKNPSVRIIDPAEIFRTARSLGTLSATDLEAALNALVERGFLVAVIKVKSPDGVLVGPEFSTFSEIPDRLRDSFDHVFNVEDGDVVPAYRRR